MNGRQVKTPLLLGSEWREREGLQDRGSQGVGSSSKVYGVG